jgi:hypothetical protein
MSLDDRLRHDLGAIASTIEPEVEPALQDLLARRAPVARSRTVLPRVLAVAASLALVGGLLVWWLGRAHGQGNDFVNDPAPPAGTYGSGDWRLRLGGDLLSVVAPDRTAIGSRSAFGSSTVDGDVLTTDLLDDDGRCSGDGSYRWTREHEGLRLQVVDDTCDLRTQLLTGKEWEPVQGESFEPGTYRAELTIGLMRRTALAEGFARADVDDYLDTSFPGASTVVYTLTAQGGAWVVHESIDEAADDVAWAGRFVVLDPATVQATTSDASCGSILYDVRPDGDTVSFVVVTDACPTPDTAPFGELIAQTTIYESRPFTRLPD